jgi:amidohydrolase
MTKVIIGMKKGSEGLFLRDNMDVKSEADNLFGFTQSTRRDIHQHPEVGYNEFRTAKLISDELSALGFVVKIGLGKTGVVGVINGKTESQVVMLRFDMDALPIQEANTIDYVSQNPGIMHACGHDSHVAVGLTVAKILAEHKNDLNGSVKMIFQPAEEGGAGALAMINDGALLDPMPDYALGIHVWNEKPVGWFGITEGPAMAGANMITFTVNGRGGHGAVPQLTEDPVIASAHIITALQTIVSRNVSPLESAVVSITQIEGGCAFNIIPSSVTAKGTIRTFLPEIQLKVVTRFEEIVQDVARAMNCTAETSIDLGTKPVINDKKVAKRVTKVASDLWPDAQIENDYRTMGAEDISEFLIRIPGCFILVGSANADKHLNSAHHNPNFDIDESCLPNAVALLVNATIELLENGID